MRRVGICILLLLFCCFPLYANAVEVGATGAVLVDGKTGRVLWGKNEEEPLAMASTTKIMTAILVLEMANLDDVVTISKNAANQPEVHMDLQEGEQWLVSDLLSAMMLRSYNDTAVALAEHISGSVAEFCKEMTRRASEMGAADTVFATPNGLDSQFTLEEHHSTAYDMAIITAYALENPKFREIIAQSEIYITEVNGKRQCSVTNADRFLSEYKGALGVKTGYTNRAGHCFVGAAERDDVLLISTVLASGWGTTGKEGKWKDTKALMEYGFSNFSNIAVVEKGDQYGEISVLHSHVETVLCELASGYEALFSEEEAEQLEVAVHLPSVMEAPILAGDVMGRVEILLDGEVLAEIPLLASNSAPAYVLQDWFRYLSENWVTWFS